MAERNCTTCKHENSFGDRCFECDDAYNLWESGASEHNEKLQNMEATYLQSL